MADNFKETDFFGNLEKRMSPLSFKRVVVEESYVVEREEEPGYVPMLTVQLTLVFEPRNGAALFEADDKPSNEDGDDDD